MMYMYLHLGILYSYLNIFDIIFYHLLQSIHLRIANMLRNLDIYHSCQNIQHRCYQA